MERRRIKVDGAYSGGIHLTDHMDGLRILIVRRCISRLIRQDGIVNAHHHIVAAGGHIDGRRLAGQPAEHGHLCHGRYLGSRNTKSKVVIFRKPFCRCHGKCLHIGDSRSHADFQLVAILHRIAADQVAILGICNKQGERTGGHRYAQHTFLVCCTQFLHAHGGLGINLGICQCHGTVTKNDFGSLRLCAQVNICLEAGGDLIKEAVTVDSEGQLTVIKGCTLDRIFVGIGIIIIADGLDDITGGRINNLHIRIDLIALSVIRMHCSIAGRKAVFDDHILAYYIFCILWDVLRLRSVAEIHLDLGIAV